MPIMRDSNVPDSWVNQYVQTYPVTKLPNGEYRSCPVRLAWVENLWTPGKMDGAEGEARYRVAVLWPHGAAEQMDRVVWPDFYEMQRREFPSNFNAQTNQVWGLDQNGYRQLCDENANKGTQGYTPGLFFTNMSSGKDAKPGVFDTAQNPLLEASGRVYSGVWGLVNFNLYASGKKAKGKNNAVKIGIRLGLRSVMIIQDDKKFSGVPAVDPQTAFAGVTINQHFDPANAFAPNAQQQGGVMPPSTTVAPPPPGGSAYPPAPHAAPVDPMKLLGF